MPISRSQIAKTMLGLALALFAAPATAAGDASCVTSASALAFGHYVASRDASSDFTATLTVDCTATGDSSVTIEGSISLVGPAVDRALADGPHRLRYQTFADPAHTILWSDGASARAISGVVGPGKPWHARFTVYGRILARQPNVQVGQYSDQIVAILNY